MWIFVWMVYELLFMNYFSLLLLDMGYLSFGPSCVQFSFFFFWILWTFMCPTFFSSCFLEHVLYFFSLCPCNLDKIVMNNMDFLFCGMGWMKYSCTTPGAEVGKICGVYAILIIGVWNASHKGSQQFDKAQRDNRLHM